MRLEKLILHNIRSYADASIDFPSGYVLLSGDIGSGKSTILLAVEFALFGLVRGMTQGGSLLRNGAAEGSVELVFSVQGRKIRLERTLRSQRSGIVQHDACLHIDGTQETLTPTQLRAKVLDLLGYPQQQKSLIYRYTVFTSQEQMKSILHEQADARLQTLRTMFGIEKYQQIVGNCSTVLREYKKQYQYMIGQIADLFELSDQEKELREELKEYNTSLLELSRQKDTAAQKKQVKEQELTRLNEKIDKMQQDKEKILAVRQEIEGLEKNIMHYRQQYDTLRVEISKFNELHNSPPEQINKEDVQKVKQQLEAMQEQQKELTERYAQYRAGLEQVKERIVLLQDELQTDYLTAITEHKQELLALESEITDLEKTISGKEPAEQMISSLQQQRAVLEHEINALKEIDLGSEETCPVCQQSISEEHRAHVEQHTAKQRVLLTKKLEAVSTTLSTKNSLLISIHTALKTRESVILKKAAILEKINQLQKELEQTQEKKKMLAELKEKEKNLMVNVAEAQQQLKKLDLSDLQAKVKKVDEQLLSYTTYVTARSHMEEKKDMVNNLQENMKTDQQSVEKARAMFGLLEQTTKQFESCQIEKSLLKDKLDTLFVSYNHIIGQVSQMQERITIKEQQLLTLTEAIKAKKTIESKAAKLNDVQAWFKDFFVPLVTNIEQHVFVSIYHEFNAYFQQWFSCLVEDESLKARLDINFAPQIEQNGYDIEVSYLSGGERTCVALAYRLALNKVINDVVENIHTRDLLILDEPTEGFSHEQLDRVRDVLGQLHLGQLILVSHEPKLEGFVEHILQVEKSDHTSNIALIR